MIFLILSILIGVYLWLNLSRRRRHRDSTSGLSARDRDSISGDHIQGGTRHDNIQATISRYDSMAQVRQRQQQQHDEQAKAYAEKLKLVSFICVFEKAPYTQPAPAPATLPRASQPNVYRQDTHNPLGGSGGGGWRRSSRRMGPGGG
ncbi:unnamed protein product [Didymodactylos carnosus]|nr:unnamed protein product [Didymodactylos carnosus]CAF3878067.1 unnamed protein product [Didymodactylos carnosus]